MEKIVKIAATDEDRRLVFGWASVAVDKAGNVVEDSQGDVLDPGDLETAAYQFVSDFGDANAMHAGPDVDRVVESIYVDPAKLAKMGLDPSGAPHSGWWVGFRVDDQAAWDGVKSGKYGAFSIEGAGQRIPA